MPSRAWSRNPFTAANPISLLPSDTLLLGMDDRSRNLVEQARQCVAFAIGPNGEADGILLFGSPGFVSASGDAIEFALTTIPEGSQLRAWLRISVYTGLPVPWMLVVCEPHSGETIVVRGAAQLVRPVGETPDPRVSLSVRIAPFDVSERRSAMTPIEQPAASPVAIPTADLRTVRAMAENRQKTLTDVARGFLERCNGIFLCGVGEDGQPRLWRSETLEYGYQAARVVQAPDESTVYIRDDDGTPGSSSPAILIGPNYHAQLALRVHGAIERIEPTELSPALGAAFAGATGFLKLAVSSVDAQAGDWSLRVAERKPTGTIRVSESVLRIHGTSSIGRPEVSFVDGPTVLAREGQSLLELAEANGVPMEAGCRMGICGADPVKINEGAENLSGIRRSEQSTLDRLGLPPGCRMACSARVRGSVTVAAISDVTASWDAPTASGSPRGAPSWIPNPDVKRVVVIGTGIAGITVVEEVRKIDARVDVTVLGTEPYDFYNRMAISRLLDENLAPETLSLMSTDWAERRRVRFAPGVTVTSIDRAAHTVQTEAGPVPYDRLVLATGAQSMIPPIDGVGLQGSYALRTIDDALKIRRHVSHPPSRRAVIIGGGLLGLEAAYHLSQTGLRVWVVGRADWPADRQLDEQAGRLLAQMLQDLGIEYLPRCEPRCIVGTDRVEGIELSDGRVLEAGTCLIATGITPDTALARAADLEVVNGVVVDDHMRTSDPVIYAAGDVIEYRGRGFGLWPASVDQARIAATNLMGGDESYNATMAPAQLKVPGIDLLSVGQIVAHDDEEGEVQTVNQQARGYRKLVHRNGRAIGAILIGSSDLFDDVSDAVLLGRDFTSRLAALEQGEWGVFQSDAGEPIDEVPVAPGAVMGG